MKNYRDFLGREEELDSLKSLKDQKKPRLVVAIGRRRIGKSALIHKFSKGFKNFYEFQGIPPRKDIGNKDQLKNFAELIKLNFNVAEPILNNWTEAFGQLAKELEKKTALLFLDEISWMGKYDPDFCGKLKIAWDTKLSRIPGLIVVLCGSVSAWIEENILKSTDFVGRVSLTIKLKELDLYNSLNFWGNKNISPIERLKYLCITGCVPKYLEEFNPSESTDTNIKRLCFSKGGYLLEDFEKIFNDIFERRAKTYKEIVKFILANHLTAQQIANKLKIDSSGIFIQYLQDLEQSGFIARDYAYKYGGEKSKLSKFRISDNYLRFYLKYIEPNKDKIEKGIYKFKAVSELLAWESIIGLQFENLILNHISEIIEYLNLQQERILSASPYFQTKTQKTKPCQIDLLIECKPNNFYICEIKFQRFISTQVITEMKKKLEVLKLPKYSSKRPVLIYAGELDPKVEDADFFDKIVNVGELFDRRNKTKAAIAYTRFLDDNPDEESLLAKWDSVDLEAPLKIKKKSNKKSKKI